jgi:hypothetical protein
MRANDYSHSLLPRNSGTDDARASLYCDAIAESAGLAAHSIDSYVILENNTSAQRELARISDANTSSHEKIPRHRIQSSSQRKSADELN